jgi:integrase
MGDFVTRAITDTEFKDIINTIRSGYVDHEGVTHLPNHQVADILVLEANLGCRLGDIINLRHDSFVLDGGIWKLDITEEKTGKKRHFIVPQAIKDLIDNMNYGKDGKLFGIAKPAVWKQMRNVTRYLGLQDVSSHSFRKYCANSLYERTGHDIELVCEFLQHSSIKITRRYIRRSDSQLEKAIAGNVSIA